MSTKKRELKVVFRQIVETLESQAQVERVYDFIFERAYEHWKNTNDLQTSDSPE